MRIATILALVTIVLVGGCAQQEAQLEGTNRVSVLLTDAPKDATCLFVEFGRVDLVPAAGTGGGVVTVYEGDLVAIDVLGLTNGEVEVLGVADSVPDGDYGQVRLIVESATLFFDKDCDPDEDEGDEVFVPSGAQTGLKINVEPPLSLEGEEERYVLIDFDVERAIVGTPPGSGNYLLKPTAIRAFSEVGAIEGTVVELDVDVDEGAVVAEELDGEDGSPTKLEGVRVEVYPAGSSDDAITSTYTDGDGFFAFIALLAGSYDLRFSHKDYVDAWVLDVDVELDATKRLEDVKLVKLEVSD